MQKCVLTTAENLSRFSVINTSHKSARISKWRLHGNVLCQKIIDDGPIMLELFENNTHSVFFWNSSLSVSLLNLFYRL